MDIFASLPTLGYSKRKEFLYSGSKFFPLGVAPFWKTAKCYQGNFLSASVVSLGKLFQQYPISYRYLLLDSDTLKPGHEKRVSKGICESQRPIAAYASTKADQGLSCLALYSLAYLTLSNNEVFLQSETFDSFVKSQEKKHMLWILIWSSSVRCFKWVPTTYTFVEPNTWIP